MNPSTVVFKLFCRQNTEKKNYSITWEDNYSLDNETESKHIKIIIFTSVEWQLLPLMCSDINPLCANPTKWSNTLKQFVGNLSVFDHFVILALQWLTELSYLKIRS